MATRTSTRIKRQRLQALRELRRRQRAADSAIERLERRIDRMLELKTPITPSTAETLLPRWREFFARVRDLEGALSDFLSFVSEQTVEIREVLE